MDADSNILDDLLASARASSRENNPARVIAACEKALAIAPGDTRFVFMHGIALRRTGEFASAEPLLQKIVAAAPGLATAHLELGLVYVSQNRLSDARTSLELAVELDQSLSPAWRVLRDVRFAEGDDSGAADAFRRALGTSKPDPALQKALDLFAAGRVGVAEGICREYLRQRPLDVNAIRLLAEIGTEFGRPRRGYQAARTLSGTRPRFSYCAQ